MQISHKKGSDKKLVAVLGANSAGVFFRYGTGTVFVSELGVVTSVDTHVTLEQILVASNTRRPVYEGDGLTLTF